MSFTFVRWFSPAVGVLLAASAVAQPPTLNELWPHDDGRSWKYTQHYEDFEQPEVIDGHTRIFFEGTTLAPGAIHAQYLRQETVGPTPARALEANLSDPFLRTLWRARPDLHAKILEAIDDAPCPNSRAPGSYGYLLNGELAYVQSSDEIGAWRCNLADTKAWLWLVSDLTIGNTFDLQLIPDLTSDVFLHGTIAAIEPVTTPAGTFESCVRVDYVIDFGSSVCVDEGGVPTGTFRSETRGHVHYAPGVGPVGSSEDFIPYADLTGTCGSALGIGQPATRVTLQLETLPTPVRRTTWGQLKLSYH